MRHLKILFNTFFADKKNNNEASLEKIANTLKNMGLVDIPSEEYPILLETMDKNKDGVIDFNDFVSQIPMFDSDKVFQDSQNYYQDSSNSPRKNIEVILYMYFICTMFFS